MFLLILILVACCAVTVITIYIGYFLCSFISIVLLESMNNWLLNIPSCSNTTKHCPSPIVISRRNPVTVDWIDGIQLIVNIQITCALTYLWDNFFPWSDTEYMYDCFEKSSSLPDLPHVVLTILNVTYVSNYTQNPFCCQAGPRLCKMAIGEIRYNSTIFTIPFLDISSEILSRWIICWL
jgi:hypothetical protein